MIFHGITSLEPLEVNKDSYIVFDHLIGHLKIILVHVKCLWVKPRQDFIFLSSTANRSEVGTVPTCYKLRLYKKIVFKGNVTVYLINSREKLFAK